MNRPPTGVVVIVLLAAAVAAAIAVQQPSAPRPSRRSEHRGKGDSQNPNAFTPDIRFVGVTGRKWTGTSPACSNPRRGHLNLPAVHPDQAFFWVLRIERDRETIYHWHYTRNLIWLRSGTSAKPRFDTTLQMPPGSYMVKMELHKVSWDVPNRWTDAGVARMSSFNAEVR